MTDANPRIPALVAALLCALLATPAAAQFQRPAPPPMGVLPSTLGPVGGYDQVTLQQIYFAQQQAALLQNQQLNQQLMQQAMANNELQRQQLVNGFQQVAKGQSVSSAFAPLIQSSDYNPAFAQSYGVVGGGNFGVFPQYSGYAGYPGQAGGGMGMGMPNPGPAMGGAPQAGAGQPPLVGAPDVPFEAARAMKTRAFDTEQHRAALARQKAAKHKPPIRKPAAKKAPAPKPAPAEAEE